LVLARPRTPRKGLGLLQFTTAGRYVVHRMEASGLNPVVAEVAARSGGAQVALPEGKYEIILRNPDHILHGTVEVRDGAVAWLSVDKMQRTEYACLVRKGGEPSRAWSMLAYGGVHSAPFALQGPSPLTNDPSWSERNVGPALGLSLRRDSRHVSLEARLIWERDHRDNIAQFTLDTQMFTGSVAALWALDLGPVTLGQRRVYILPTGGGLMFAVTILLMLIGSINYNLSLGYVLVFLLAGNGMVSMLHTWRNLARISLRPGKAAAVFAGEFAGFRVQIENAGSLPRVSLAVQLAGQSPEYFDVATGRYYVDLARKMGIGQELE